ncbi:hypothetical protein N657DRAFT_660018 [Parathielavia appendiculata]|uniref:Uncharacterized protein n=1 Tax=Parathielavia appendiculata TaxID=2587402 RepID=A0AAN6U888_9PEZI|nr:hypothetical protein N657DRAFT_660018 [Parathielavia appendiculata]
MGGSAFSSLPDPPYTPRMSRSVYQHVVPACHAALRELFVCVATPIEGPEKKDHGDIDILVALERRVVFPKAMDHPVQSPPHELMGAVQRVLHAKDAIIHPTGSSANLAIPWPSNMNPVFAMHDEASMMEDSATNHEEPRDKYIQVDVRICPDVDQLCWILFKHAHGDIWNLLGSTIRPFGLTLDEEALWLRIPEIEQFDRKKAKVCLSREPVEILHFLGMKVEGFWAEPFESVDALFDYATTCRLFYVRATPDDDADADAAEAGVIGGEEGRKKLRSNDRRRMKGRPVYRRWIDEFIPGLRAQGIFVRKGPGTSVEEVRCMVRDEAFARFFVELEYKQRLREWQLKKNREHIKSVIKEQVPIDIESQRRACLISAMRKIVMEDDSSFGTVPPGLKDRDGFYNTEAVCSFVQGNLDRVGDIAWTRQQQKAKEAILLKESSLKVEAGIEGIV